MDDADSGYDDEDAAMEASSADMDPGTHEHVELDPSDEELSGIDLNTGDELHTWCQHAEHEHEHEQVADPAKEPLGIGSHLTDGLVVAGADLIIDSDEGGAGRGGIGEDAWFAAENDYSYPTLQQSTTLAESWEESVWQGPGGLFSISPAISDLDRGAVVVDDWSEMHELTKWDDLAGGSITQDGGRPIDLATAGADPDLIDQSPSAWAQPVAGSEPLALAGELWLEFRPDELAPTDNDGVALPPHDVIAELLRGDNDPITRDVLGRILDQFGGQRDG